MKKIVGNRMYNTETAELMVDAIMLHLYQKENGEFFTLDLADDIIKPLNKEEARAFLEEHTSEGIEGKT